MSDAEAGIEELHERWSRAIRDAALEDALELLTPDYVLWAPGAEPLTGREAVRTLFESAFAAYDIEPSFELEERLVSGDLAVERGWDVQTVAPRGGGPSQVQRQRVFVVLRRDGGQWRFARGISQPGPGADPP